MVVCMHVASLTYSVVAVMILCPKLPESILTKYANEENCNNYIAQCLHHKAGEFTPSPSPQNSISLLSHIDCSTYSSD